MRLISSLRLSDPAVWRRAAGRWTDRGRVYACRVLVLWRRMVEWLEQRATAWLLVEKKKIAVLSPINFEHLLAEVRMGDVLLVEGRTRVAHAVRAITQSIWTHSALVIGTLDMIRDPALRAVARGYLRDDELDAPLIVESELGCGTTVSSILRYRDHHLRLCRPQGLSHTDARRVTTYALLHLGAGYNVRQILDLARFLVPWWAVVPRRWHSSLFEHNYQDPTRLICSTMIARAFSRVRFPVVPLVVESEGQFRMVQRNPRLITPRDFDHSPYFSVIKYPLLGRDDIGFYRKLPWSEEGLAEEAQESLEDCNIMHVKLDHPESEEFEDVQDQPDDDGRRA